MSTTHIKFLRAVQAIADESPDYQLGRDGSDGKCDCIGLIIGALKRCGVRWDGIHGTNWAARNAMQDLAPLNAPQVGMWVYKALEPGKSGYSLPARYDGDADRRDYYHVGVVTSVSPLRITHMTTPKPSVDNKVGKWRYGGMPKSKYYSVDDKEDGGMPMETAVVHADSGSTVNMRRKARSDADLVERVPIGESVTVAERGDDWSAVEWHGKTGWMMSKYLVFSGDGGGVGVTPAMEFDPDAVHAKLDQISELVEEIHQMIGRG